MVAAVLRSPAAIDMSIHVVRAFVNARRLVDRHRELADELGGLKKVLSAKFGEYDKQFHIVFEAINRLISPENEKKRRRRIGFESE